MHKHGDSIKTYSSMETVVKRINFNADNTAKNTQTNNANIGKVPFTKGKSPNTSFNNNYVRCTDSISSPLFPVTVIGFYPNNFQNTSIYFTKIGNYSKIDYNENTNYFSIAYLSEEDAGKALNYDGIEFNDKEKIAVIGEFNVKTRVEGQSNITNVSMSKCKLPRKTKSNLRIILECLCLW